MDNRGFAPFGDDTSTSRETAAKDSKPLGNHLCRPGRPMGVSIDLALSLFVQYGYWIIFVAIVLDNAGLPIPGARLLLLFGALARGGDLDLGLGLLVGAAAAMAETTSATGSGDWPVTECSARTAERRWALEPASPRPWATTGAGAWPR